MKQYDISDDDLAKLVNVNRTTVSRWRSGERSPKMEKLPEIAGIFKIDPRIFVGEELSDDSNELLITFHELDKKRKNEVVDFAKFKLHEQRKNVTPIQQIDESSIEPYTLAAHSADPNKKYTEEEIETIQSKLAAARKKYEDKNK